MFFCPAPHARLMAVLVCLLALTATPLAQASRLSESAERGNPWSMYAMGWAIDRQDQGLPIAPAAWEVNHWPQEGKAIVGLMKDAQAAGDVPRDMKQAVAWYAKARKPGVTAATLRLSECCADGRGMTEANENVAAQLLTQAVQANDPEAMYLMAHQTLVEASKKQLLPNEWDDHVDWPMFEKCAAQGHVEASLWLAINSQNKNIAPGLQEQVLRQRIQTVLTAQRLDYPFEQYKDNPLTHTFMCGLVTGAFMEGWSLDMDVAPLMDSLPAFSGELDGAVDYELSKAHQLGIGTPINLPKAFEHAKKSAELGHKDAHSILARLYLRGESTPINLDLALEHAKAFKTDDHPIGWHVLGDIHQAMAQNGQMAKLDDMLPAYQKAAELGDPGALIVGAMALNTLAPKDPRQNQLLRAAHAAGMPEGLFLLSTKLFMDDKGKPSEETLEVLKQASDRGYGLATFCLAYTHLEGLGRPVNTTLGNQYLQRAILQGDADAVRYKNEPFVFAFD